MGSSSSEENEKGSSSPQDGEKGSSSPEEDEKGSKSPQKGEGDQGHQRRMKRPKFTRGEQGSSSSIEFASGG